MTIGLVGQDVVTTFTSPVNGTSPIDANVVRGNDNTVKAAFNVHDADASVHLQSSLASARPPAGVPGRKWIDADTYRVYYDDGAAWHEVAYVSTGAGGATINGPLTVNGPLTTSPNVIVTGTAAQSRGLSIQTAGAARWYLAAGASGEPGADVGSDLILNAYSDAAAFIDSPVVIARAAGGPITLNRPVTIVGDLTAQHVTASPNVIVTGTAAQSRGLVIETGASLRWYLYGAGAEGGADSGTDFQLKAYSDAAVLIDAPLTIVRAVGGLITLNRPVVATHEITAASRITSQLNFVVSNAAAYARGLALQTLGSNRWYLAADAGVESSGNAGSPFVLQAYSDAAVLIDAPITIARAAGGAITLSRPTIFQGNAIVTTPFAAILQLSPGGVASGSAQVMYMDLAAAKWQVGNNVNIGGGNFEFYNNALAATVMRLTPAGAAIVGVDPTGSASLLRVGGEVDTRKLHVYGAAGAADAHLQLLGAGGAQFNWEIATNQTVVNALQFIPSTVAGGNIFSTPLLTLTAAGLDVQAGGGFAIGSLANRRRLVTNGPADFAFLSDGNGYATLTVAGLTIYGLGNGALTVGAADSGGAGFRMIRVPN